MRYRKLGKYSIKVSEVGLGGWLTQGRTLADETTDIIVHKAFDLGVNFFDTADVYNKGEAELSLGKAIVGLRREDLVIATKCFFPFTDAPNDRGNGRKHLFESVHNSLKRMRVDYIDLMQFHRFDPETPMEETVRAIDDLIRQGKVLYWGVSEWQSHQIGDAVMTAKALNANPPVSNQPQYNMVNRWIEKAVIPTSEQLGLGQVVFSPLAQGILTGKYVPGESAPQGSRGADDTSNNFMQGLLSDQALLERVQNLKVYANEQGYTLAQFSLAWCLRQKNVSSVIVGATSPEQMEVNASASGVDLPAEVWEKAEKILDGTAEA